MLLHALNLVNGPLNRATVDALELTPGERVLDIGFGGGIGIRRALQAGASVVAIDPSPTAVDAARRRFKNTVVIRQAGVDDPGEQPASCDAAYTVNTIYFWPDLTSGLRALHRVLRPGGRLAIGIEGAELARHSAAGTALPPTASGLSPILAEAGFTDIDIHRRRAGRAILLARTPA